MGSSDGKAGRPVAGAAWPITRIPAFQGVGDPFAPLAAESAARELLQSAHFDTIQLHGAEACSTSTAEVPLGPVPLSELHVRTLSVLKSTCTRQPLVPVLATHGQACPSLLS